MLLLLVVTPTAQAHVPDRPKEIYRDLRAKESFQLRVLTHAQLAVRKQRTVLRFFEKRPGVIGRNSEIAIPVIDEAKKALRFHLAQRLWTFRELRETQQAIQATFVGNKAAWLCIHRYEGDWKDGGNPYWGGLQMDLNFMQSYGGDMLRKYGYPRGSVGPNGWLNAWTPMEQMMVAQRAYASGRGYGPWPNTARMCNLL